MPVDEQKEVVGGPPTRLQAHRVLEWAGIIGVTLLAAGLRLWRIGQNGFGNSYYAAAVRSMQDDWSNFFFGSFDPAGFITVDKPPVALWVQALSAKVLGYSGLSLLLPQALMGCASVVLVYLLVRRSFGAGAGLLAGLVLAITPISVAVDRDNLPDTALVLVLLLASWGLLRAVETGRLRPLLMSAALVGLGFNVKMLAAFVVLPTFYLVYLLLAQVRWWKRLRYLAAATVVLALVSLSWSVAVEFTPPEDRPYIGGSKHNSAIELAVGYNGLGRVFGGSGNFRPGSRGGMKGQPPGPQKGPQQGGPPTRNQDDRPQARGGPGKQAKGDADNAQARGPEAGAEGPQRGRQPGVPRGSGRPGARGLPEIGASTLGLLATPLGQGPIIAASALVPARSGPGFGPRGPGGPGGGFPGGPRGPRGGPEGLGGFGPAARGLPVIAASALGLLAAPLGQGPIVAASALAPGRSGPGFGPRMPGGPGGGFAPGGPRTPANAGPPGGPGQRGGPGGPGGFGGTPGMLRFAGPQLAGQITWLFPLALIGVAVSVFRVRWRPLDPTLVMLFLWAGWLVTHWVVFSWAQGIFHEYYTTVMGPAVAVLAAVGVLALWQMWAQGGWRRTLLPVALLLTAAWETYVVNRYSEVRSWMLPALLGGVGVGSVGLIVMGFLGRRRWATHSGMVAAGIGVASLLIGPRYWSLTPLFRTGNAVMPVADPGALAGRGGARPPGPLSETESEATTALVEFLRANRNGERFLVAAASSRTVAPIIIHTGEPAIAIGGFMGADPTLTKEEFARLVEEGQLRFVLDGGGGPGGAPGRGPGVAGQAPGAAPDGPGAGTAEVMEWVRTHGKEVDSRLWAPEPAGENPRAAAGVGRGRSFGPGRPVGRLYDCKPELGLVSPEGSE
jgi:4-amino-4-deoxy-L-arabinose transferase-like glycosyltransferase